MKCAMCGCRIRIAPVCASCDEQILRDDGDDEAAVRDLEDAMRVMTREPEWERQADARLERARVSVRARQLG